MNNPRFRPPAEADSVILQTDTGCPHNTCAFCGMYKDMPYKPRDMAEIETLIHEEARRDPDARRIFLGDGDVMRRPAKELATILELLARYFPRLARVNLYANGTSVTAKTDTELKTLRRFRMHTLYMGLESGDQSILASHGKNESVEGMIRAGQRAQAAGMRISVMVLTGLGGREKSAAHAGHTAEALNRMQPRLLSALRIIPVPGTALAKKADSGKFQMLSEYETIAELRMLMASLQLKGTVFRADHSSNIIPMQGRLPENRDEFLYFLDTLLASDKLDRNGPGTMPLWL